MRKKFFITNFMLILSMLLLLQPQTSYAAPAIAPAMPLTNVTVSAYDTVNIYWGQPTNGKIDGYTVFRSTSIDGVYSPIFTTQKNITRYSDKPGYIGKTYYYKVCSYVNRKNSNGKYEPYYSNGNVCSATPMPSALKNVTASYVPNKGIQISWNEIDGVPLANKLFATYSIYRSNSINGHYTKILSGFLKTNYNTTTYIDPNVVLGETYYYNVVAECHGFYQDSPTTASSYTYESAPSTVSAAILPGTPSIKSVTKDLSKPTMGTMGINWTSVSDDFNVSYELYIATKPTGGSFGDYRKIKLSSFMPQTSYSCSIMRGYEYSVKVRAVYKNQYTNQSVFGPFSTESIISAR